MFDVNHATGEATLSVSSTHTVPNYHFQQLFQDQNYLYLVTTKIFVFDPATLNLVTEISGPSASDGTFQPIKLWSDDSYLFVASGHQGIRVYSIDAGSNSFTYVNAFGTLSNNSWSGDLYFDVNGDSVTIYILAERE